MSREDVILNTRHKALHLNKNSLIYGSLAEIGAGQEVARQFFQAGGASGSIAKTVSAYDMGMSDSIYGVDQTGRYVSLTRLESTDTSVRTQREGRSLLQRTVMFSG